MRHLFLLLTAVSTLVSIAGTAHADTPSSDAIEELSYMQHPGLPPAASKIFFSKRRWTISGFGELAYIHHLGETNRSSGDIEIYDTNLYRFTLYGAVRPTDWLVLYGEAFLEVYHDGLREIHYEALPETFADFLVTRPSAKAREDGARTGPLNVRAGFIQVPIGFINQNDEPIMFYSVNRPDVERLIVPSQWVELGVEAYGRIGKRFEWLVHGFQGSNVEEMVGATWIRRGRNPGYEFKAPAAAAQVIIRPTDQLELSTSGVAMKNGISHVDARTGLVTAYARYEVHNWSVMALGALGFMTNTKEVYELRHEILGERTYGYYLELGCDVLPYFRKATAAPTWSFFYRSDEVKVPLFVRYSRLDTHADVDDSLVENVPDQPIFRSDLHMLTVGVNFRPRRNIVLKADYQFRSNMARGPGLVREGDQIQLGLGFIF